MTPEQKTLRQIRRSLNAGENPRDVAKKYGVRVQLVRDIIAKKRKTDTLRKCLNCNNYFLSEGKGNRICEACKRKHAKIEYD